MHAFWGAKAPHEMSFVLLTTSTFFKATKTLVSKLITVRNLNHFSVPD